MNLGCLITLFIEVDLNDGLDMLLCLLTKGYSREESYCETDSWFCQGRFRVLDIRTFSCYYGLRLWDCTEKRYGSRFGTKKRKDWTSHSRTRICFMVLTVENSTYGMYLFKHWNGNT